METQFKNYASSPLRMGWEGGFPPCWCAWAGGLGLTTDRLSKLTTLSNHVSWDFHHKRSVCRFLSGLGKALAMGAFFFPQDSQALFILWTKTTFQTQKSSLTCVWDLTSGTFSHTPLLHLIIKIIFKISKIWPLLTTSTAAMWSRLPSYLTWIIATVFPNFHPSSYHQFPKP